MKDLARLEEERKNKRGEVEEPENVRKKKKIERKKKKKQRNIKEAKKHYLIKEANKISLFHYSFELCAQLLAVHCL